LNIRTDGAGMIIKLTINTWQTIVLLIVAFLLGFFVRGCGELPVPEIPKEEQIETT